MNTNEKQQTMNEASKFGARSARRKVKKDILVPLRLVFNMEPPQPDETREEYELRMDAEFERQWELHYENFLADYKCELLDKVMERVAADAGWPEEGCGAAGESHSASCNT